MEKEGGKTKERGSERERKGESRPRLVDIRQRGLLEDLKGLAYFLLNCALNFNLVGIRDKHS